MQSAEKVTLDALLKKDLREYITSLDLEEDFDNGKIKCISCEDTLSIDSIGVIYFENKTPKFICSKTLCCDDVPINK